MCVNRINAALPLACLLLRCGLDHKSARRINAPIGLPMHGS